MASEPFAISRRLAKKVMEMCAFLLSTIVTQQVLSVSFYVMLVTVYWGKQKTTPTSSAMRRIIWSVTRQTDRDHGPCYYLGE